MKTIVTLMICCCLWISLFAQAPQKMSYQAVIRDVNGKLVTNQMVGMRITIFKGSLPGTSVYSETQTLTTNSNGLVTVEMGGGTGFDAIDWGSDVHFIKTETDPIGGTSYSITGTSQLLSVPYALYSKDVLNNNDADADATNELQKITLSGTVLTLDKSGGSVTLPSSGGGDNWGTQSVVPDATLTGNGTTAAPLKIADNGVTSPKILDGTIVTADLANNSVTSAKIADGTIVNADIADNAVNSSRIQDASVGTSDIAGNAITTAQLANNAVTVAKLPSGATADKYLRGDGIWANPPVGITTETDPTWSGAANETVATGRTGNVGIGTTSPTALLHTVGTGIGQGNVVFVGQKKDSNPGNPPVSGAGTRMMWYPDKAAFRAGYVNGSHWDTGNTGDFSVAMGYNTMAIGTGSIALGIETYATSESTAMGIGVNARGLNSTAMGKSTIASGDHSTALGEFTHASGSMSTSMGWCTSASNSFSTAMGNHTVASGSNSTAMGLETTASGHCSMAMGYKTAASGDYSTTMGYQTTASGDNSTTMGYQTTASGCCSTALGRWNVDGGNSFSWVGTDPLFEIGNGTSATSRSNALTVLKNGYVGFGTAYPAAGLHISANSWPGSFIYLQSALNQDAGMRVYEGDALRWHIFNDASAGGLLIQNYNLNNAIFCQQSNSNVGIGTTTPFYKLQVGNAGDGTQARANAWNLLSDIRLKRDLTGIANALEMADKIDGYYYYWNTGTDKGRQLGFSAQQVSEVLPEVVSKGEDGYLSIEYGKMAPLLVEAIKELKAENDRLKLQNGQLHATVESMESRLSKLESFLEATSNK